MHKVKKKKKASIIIQMNELISWVKSALYNELNK